MTFLLLLGEKKKKDIKRLAECCTAYFCLYVKL